MTAFARSSPKEFSDMWVVDLGSDVRRNPKISGTTHNVFGIKTGVAIAILSCGTSPSWFAASTTPADEDAEGLRWTRLATCVDSASWMRLAFTGHHA